MRLSRNRRCGGVRRRQVRRNPSDRHTAATQGRHIASGRCNAGGGCIVPIPRDIPRGLHMSHRRIGSLPCNALIAGTHTIATHGTATTHGVGATHRVATSQGVEPVQSLQHPPTLRRVVPRLVPTCAGKKDVAVCAKMSSTAMLTDADHLFGARFCADADWWTPTRPSPRTH